MTDMELFKKALAKRSEAQSENTKKEGIESTILKEICEIEKREKVTILYCALSGSRAWGYNALDSVYEVRFIYKRNETLSETDGDKTSNKRDEIRWQKDGVLDINGCDIKKATDLIKNSNPTIYEWSVSPTVYKRSLEWQQISENIKNHFSVKETLIQYLDILSAKSRGLLKQEKIKIDDYFEVLIPLLCCKHLINANSFPKLNVAYLMENYLELDVKTEANNLLQLNLSSTKSPLIEKNSLIDGFIEKTVLEMKDYISAL
ncbi:MAG: nucleotidyltransferase domain-containing protein [Clostridia bacterium]|nr:nucleotidyltransferase domain-containing protein [Clostridia bacterium]